MDALRVWINDIPVGRLARHGNGVSFAYDAGVDPKNAVSLTMPVRVASYDTAFGMLPIFDTNLPEGALRDRIQRALSKIQNDRIDAIDVLSLTGGNQIGRIRILPEGECPMRRQPIGTISSLLDRDANKALIAEVMERYALRSGVSGAMPKVLVDDLTSEDEDDHHRSTIQTRDYILKFDDVDFPGLSLNEFHCLETARLAGIRVAETNLSRDGKMLAVRRFDEEADERLGFEDFASLSGKVSEEKYIGSIERNLFKTLEAVSGPMARQNLEDLYRLVVLNIGLRNGDAHLKNYSVLFRDAATGPIVLAPAYDIVTTPAFIEGDAMALTYGGTSRWPKAQQILQMGARAKLTPARSAEIMREVGEAIQARIPVMVDDLTERGHGSLAEKMRSAWNEGLEASLGMRAVPAPEPLFETDTQPADPDEGYPEI